MQALLSLLAHADRLVASSVCDTAYHLSTVPPGQRGPAFQVWMGRLGQCVLPNHDRV